MVSSASEQLNLTIGCLLFSSWANMILLTIECILAYKYFKNYRKDTWFNRISVLGCLAADVFTVYCCLGVNYLYMVTHWGSVKYLASQPIEFPLFVLGTGITAAIVQIWLTRLVYNLTKQWFWVPVISLFILTGVVGASATASQLFLHTSYTGRDALIRYVSIWLSGCSAADVFITGVLVWKFRTIRSSSASTQQLLHRSLIASVRNGSITTVMTLVALVVFSIQPETNSATMLEIVIGRVYTISMLSNLNNRSVLLGELHPSSSIKKTNLPETTATALRIHQEVETHYQYDTDEIPMGNTQYMGKKSLSKDLESADADGNSDVGVKLPVVVAVKETQSRHYDNGY